MGRGGHNKLTVEQHHKRGTFRRDRHEVGDGSPRDGRPALHSLAGHRLATAGLPMTLACKVIYALRDNPALEWADVPGLIAKLRG